MPVNFRRSIVPSLAFAASVSLASSIHAEPLPARVHAEYEITFNGLKVGGFEFNSQTDANAFKMDGGGKVTVMFGAFKWSGSSSASGKLDNTAIRPADFVFDLKGTTKAGSTRMTFADGIMTKADITPPPKPRPDAIPLQPQHLKGALDPMTAVMAITRGGNDPCSRTVPVFDGQRRLDLVLSPHGQTLLQSADAKAPVTGIVCRVNYKLVAGHRPGDETAYMNKHQNIEMVLRPVPSANVYVPYQITAWTLLGKISVHSKKVVITPASPANQQIVLVH